MTLEVQILRMVGMERLKVAGIHDSGGMNRADRTTLRDADVDVASRLEPELYFLMSSKVSTGGGVEPSCSEDVYKHGDGSRAMFHAPSLQKVSTRPSESRQNPAGQPFGRSVAIPEGRLTASTGTGLQASRAIYRHQRRWKRHPEIMVAVQEEGIKSEVLRSSYFWGDEIRVEHLRCSDRPAPPRFRHTQAPDQVRIRKRTLRH
ncbi:hypothetical protein DFH09DRAFT_1427221 [Mycena vulgaris]|nr:hypothetical protein DFH09DRAFT_1427221 [Mycena vulgaris]